MSSADLESSWGSVAFWDESDNETVVIGPKDVDDFNPENVLPKSNETQGKIHEWLTPTQYDGDGSDYQAHLSAHLPGTGRWVLDSDIYQQWHESNDHGVLWIRGIPGAGKSVLASTLIHHLRQQNIPVLYFFFRHTIDTNNSQGALLRDWLAQTIKYSPPLQHELEERRGNHSVLNLSLAELWRYLRRALMYLPKVYCIVDAVDEINSEHLEPLVKSLDALGRWRPSEIKLVVTSRPVAVVERVFLRGVKTLDVRLDKKRVEGDIERYVQHRLDLSSVSSEHYELVRQAILQKADGLFLYAKLVLDTLLQSNKDLLHDITKIPTNLANIYTNLLQEHSRKINGIPDGIQKFVLQLVVYATRPLRLIEIMDLVRVTYKRHNLEITKDIIRSICGPLLEVLPDETVRIVHYSLAEYLTGATESQNEDAREFPVFSYRTSHYCLANACLLYLGSGCLDGIKYKKRHRISGDVNYVEPASLNDGQVLPPFTRYAGSNWAVHTQRAISVGQDPSGINKLLDDLLIPSNLDKIDILINTRMDFEPTPMHFAIGLGLQDYVRHLLFNRKSEYTKNGSLEDSLILYAATKGSETIVRLLLDHGANTTPRDDRGRTPLHLAVQRGSPEVSAILLDAGVDANISRGRDNYFGMPGERQIPWTPADNVFARGSFEMVLVFYRRLKSPEAMTKALYQSVSNQNRRATKLLLQHPKLDVNAYHQGSTSLYAACSNRDLETIEMLLKSGAVIKSNIPISKRDRNLYRYPRYRAFVDSELDDMDSETESDTIELELEDPLIEHRGKSTSGEDATDINRCSNVLHAWASPRLYGSERPKLSDEEVARGVKILLAHGADMCQVNEEGKTPLHCANDAATVRALLESGGNPNILTSSGLTLLHECESMEILDILLSRADLNLRTRDTKRTPLLHTLVEGYYNSEAERVEKAIRLIESGADVNAVDKYGNSVLHLAVGMRDAAKFGVPLIGKLCSSGANVNLKNRQGKTPLHMNAPGSGWVDSLGCDGGSFNPQIFHLLIEAGADVNALDDIGQNVLFQCMANSTFIHEHVRSGDFDTIISAGAKVDILDSAGRSLFHAFIRNGFLETSLFEHLIKWGINPLNVDCVGNTLFHEAAFQLAKITSKYQFTSLVKQLTDVGVDPRGPNQLGRTPLHLLASINPGSFDPTNSYSNYSRPTNADDPAALDLYLHLYPDTVDRADKHGVRPLHLASTFSEYITRRLLEKGASPFEATDEGLTPFHLAARSRQSNIIGILTESLRSTTTAERTAAVLNFKDGENRTALYYAAASGVVESFQLLLDAGARLNHDSYRGSAWNGCADFEKELYNWPRHRPNKRNFGWRKQELVRFNAGGVTISSTSRPHLCIEGDSDNQFFPTERLDDILRIIVSSTNEGQPDTIDKAIASSADKSFDYTVECLLRARKALLGSTEVALNENTLACLNRQHKVWSNLGAEDDRKTIIRLMTSRRYELVSDKMASINCLEWTDSSRKSPLASEFARGGFAGLLSSMASKGILSEKEKRDEDDQISKQRRSNQKPLLISACSRELPNMNVIRVLVENNKVDINARWPTPVHESEPTGRTALHYLARGDHWWQAAQAIPYLIQHGAQVDAVEKSSGLTPLGDALTNIEGPHFNRKTVETLLGLGASPNGGDSLGKSYLSWTINYPEIFQLLIRHGAVIDRSVLVKAIKQQDLSLVQMLLSNGADVNQRKVGEERPEKQLSENTFTQARQDPSTMEEMYLIDWMATMYRDSGRDPEVDNRIFRMLLDHGADPLARYAKMTVLHRVIENRQLHNCYAGGQNRYRDMLLSQPGLDFNTRDADGMTILLSMAKHHFSVNDDSNSRTIERLLQGGAEILARDHQGRSAVHHAVKCRDCRPAILDKAPQLLDLPDNEGKTPLHYAISNSRWSRNHESAHALITVGADVAHEDHEGRTPLHLALDSSVWTITASDSVKGSSHDLFDLIVSRGANVNAKTHAGETPIFQFTRNGLVTAETDLSELGTRPDDLLDGAKWDGKKYHLEREASISGIGKEDIMWTFFEQQGIDLHAVNKAGEGLLHLIVQSSEPHGQFEGLGRRVIRFKLLMEKGLDPTLEDSQHRTPLDVAAALGRDDILALFKSDH